jgi:hypothetical protein
MGGPLQLLKSATAIIIEYKINYVATSDQSLWISSQVSLHRQYVRK